MSDAQQIKSSNGKLALKVALIAAGMGLFVFAMVPMYDVFCEITGLNGKTQGQALYQAETVQSDRKVKVGFITHVDRGLPWTFEAIDKQLTVSPGEKKLVRFRITNRSQQRIIGQAVPSTTPAQASLFFAKTECFCFQNQPLEPGQSMEVAMQFFLDTELPERFRDITMSYTFFNVTDKVAATANAETPFAVTRE